MGIVFSNLREDLDTIDRILEEEDPLKPYSIIVGGVPEVSEEESEDDFDHPNSRVHREDRTLAVED